MPNLCRPSQIWAAIADQPLPAAPQHAMLPFLENYSAEHQGYFVDCPQCGKEYFISRRAMLAVRSLESVMKLQGTKCEQCAGSAAPKLEPIPPRRKIIRPKRENTDGN